MAQCRICGKEYPNGGLAKACERRCKVKTSAEATTSPEKAVEAAGKGIPMEEETEGREGAYILPMSRCPEEISLKRKGDFVKVILYGQVCEDGVMVQGVEYGR